MKLTPRELQIVTCLQQGQTNKQIGQVLGLSQHTVRDAISPMLARFEVKSCTALVAALAASLNGASTSQTAPGRRTADRRASGERRAQARHPPKAQDKH
jgi:DNA-binding CsgD family transcriptional regulator